MAVRRITRKPAPAEEEEEPRRPAARRRPAEDDDEPRRPARASRRGRDDDDDDDEAGDDGVVARGWGAHKRMKESLPSDFPNQFTVEEDEKLIKFLEDEPCANYKQHWADWMPKGSKLSYTCPGEDCPICDEVGDRPDLKTCFNVIDFTDPDHPEVKLLVVGMKVEQLIEKLHNDPKTGPLTKGYFAIYKSGDKKRTQTNLRTVKERDLPDDWDMEPLTDKQIAKYEEKCWDESAIPVTPKATLRQVAEAAAE